MGWLDWIPGMGAKKNSNSPRNAGANGSTMAVMNPVPVPGSVAPMNMAAPSAPTVGGRRRSMSRSRNGRKTMCRRHGRKRRSCRRSHRRSSRKN